MSSEPQRIHIIGGPGSGKTTLALRLAAHLDVPCYDLDVYGYEGGSGAKRPLSLKLREMEQIARQPGGVSEGAFLWWPEPLCREADLII